MLSIVFNNITIGLCADPYRSGPTWFNAANVLFDDAAVTQTGFRMPTIRTNGFFTQDLFDIVDDGVVRYSGCSFYAYSSWRSERETFTLFENVRVCHLTGRKGDANTYDKTMQTLVPPRMGGYGLYPPIFYSLAHDVADLMSTAPFCVQPERLIAMDRDS